jgi:Zn-dependent M28 family amino/carboxypeptidase
MKLLRSEEFKLKFGHETSVKVGSSKGTRDWRQASDHGAFLRAKIPYVYFGVDEHRFYHTSADNYDNLDKAFYLKAYDAILESITAIDQITSLP